MPAPFHAVQLIVNYIVKWKSPKRPRTGMPRAIGMERRAKPEPIQRQVFGGVSSVMGESTAESGPRCGEAEEAKRRPTINLGVPRGPPQAPSCARVAHRRDPAHSVPFRTPRAPLGGRRPAS